MGNSGAKLRIVTAGHVDHGKSTVLGRLLADTGSLPCGKLEQINELCGKNSKTFEYAYLIDALKDEQSQGITIDTARVFFRHGDREYVFMDAPGHMEFLQNLVTGAARAEAALLVIDASEGICENSKRHGHILSLLGITQVAVLVNKMDLVSYKKSVYDRILRDYSLFLAKLGIKPMAFIPVSALMGENIARRGENMSWYGGGSVIQMLASFKSEEPPVDKPFRLPVQDVYRFSSNGDHRRIIAGTVESGSISTGDEIVFYPSGKKSIVESVESFNSPLLETVTAGYATGLTLREQLYVQRGEIAACSDEQAPQVSTRMKVHLFWMGNEPMSGDRSYTLRLATARVSARIERIHRVVDSSSLAVMQSTDRIGRYQMAECTIVMDRAIAFDTVHTMASTGRFVIVDNYRIQGGGIVKEALPDREKRIRERVLLRNYKWAHSAITCEARAERFNQIPLLIIITGEKDCGKKPLARKLEERLFARGKLVYFLGIANILYGVDADIKGKPHSHRERFRRLAEVAHILLDAGMIVIVTAIKLSREELDIIKTVTGQEFIIWIADQIPGDIACDVQIGPGEGVDGSLDAIESALREKGVC